MVAEQIVEAELTWTGESFEPGVRVAIDPSGRISRVGRLRRAPTLRLPSKALLPGFVNAHSHAFQRGLRGLGESYPEGEEDFWGWRRSMYRLVAELDVDSFYRLSVEAYREMRAAGITAVGEFHYLHHGPGGPDFAFDDVLLQAAHDAGIRLLLLQTYYRTGGIGQPLEGAQRRFATADPPTYWAQAERLGGALRSPAQSLGAAAHSVRAADPEEIGLLRREAAARGWVFHMHVEEQELEIRQCLRRYGKSPLALLVEQAPAGERFTAVHCTRSEPQELLRFLARGGRLCVCPLTEAALGDGWIDLEPAAAAGAELCLGTDANARISFVEELRWLELGQRLRTRRRGLLRSLEGGLAAGLLRAGTRGGAASLGLDCGDIAPGAWADLVALDLDHPALRPAGPEGLAAALLFAGGNEAIAGTAVGGRWRWERAAPAEG